MQGLRAAWRAAPRLSHTARACFRNLSTGSGAVVSAAANHGNRAAAGTAVLCTAGFAAYALSTRSLAKEEEGAATRPEVLEDQASDAYELPTRLIGLPKEIVIYQYENCPFCCKVRAFLDYHKLPYRCVEVNPLTKAELRWSQYKKVPVVLLDGVQYNDSSVIISRLAAELAPHGAAQGAGGAAHARSARGPGASGRRSWWSLPFATSSEAWTGVAAPRAPTTGAHLVGASERGSDALAAEGAGTEAEWRRWLDAWYVRVLTVNIYRSSGESWQTFDYITTAGNFGLFQREVARVAGAGIMWVVSKKMRAKYGIQGDVRENLYAATDDWVAALDGRRYMGGEAPGLADISMFGVLRAVIGTDTFNDVMQHTRLGRWYEDMFNAVGESARLADA